MGEEFEITYEQAKRLLDELGLVYDSETKSFYDDPMKADKAIVKGKIERGAHGTRSALTQIDLVPFLMPQGKI